MNDPGTQQERHAPWFLIADLLHDGESLRHGPHHIEVSGGRIRRVTPGLQPENTGIARVDRRGAFVLPGLVNAHVHIVRGGMFGPTEPFSPWQVVRNLRQTLEAGVTTVGDMGCPLGLISALREHLSREPEAGPDVVAAGPLLTAPGGYPLDWMPALSARLGAVLPLDDEAAARRTVERLVTNGSDGIKVACTHRSYGGRTLPPMREDVLRAIVEEAHRLGRRVYAHAHTPDDYRLALSCGVDALMHSSFEPLDREMVRRVQDSGAFVCPTLWVFDAVCLGSEHGWDEDTRYTRHVSRAIRKEWRRFRDAYHAAGPVLPEGIAGGLEKTKAREACRTAAANLTLLREAGVPIGFGTDAAYGYCVHGRPHDELYAMARAGMPADEVLRVATSGAAQLLGLRDRGRLAEGLLADILVVDGNPAHHLHHLERVRDVFRQGRRVAPSFLGGILAPRATAGTLAGVVKGLIRTLASAFPVPWTRGG